MFSIKLQGGLGHQLFQVFSLMGISEKNSYSFSLNDDDMKREYFNTIMKNVKLNNNEKLNSDDTNSEEIFVVNESRFTQYTDIVLDKNVMPNVLLNGKFQSFQYFEHIRDKVYEMLLKNQTTVISNRVNNYLKTFREQHKNKKLISIHRRTKFNKSDYKEPLPMSYYHDSLKYFNEDECVFVIFSDDQLNTLQEFDFLKHKQFVVDDDYLELLLMSKMDGAIIANSTFGLWGAYLMDYYRCKTVVCPKYWFKEWDVHRLDFFEKHWTFIENTDMFRNVIVDPRR